MKEKIETYDMGKVVQFLSHTLWEDLKSKLSTDKLANRTKWVNIYKKCRTKTFQLSCDQ